MDPVEIIFIVIVIVLIVGVVLFYLNRNVNKKAAEQQDIIDKNKQVQTIFIIDKKKDKLENVNMPKVVAEQMPKWMKFKKNYFIKAKIGPQIMTFMCDKKVFNAITVKKNVKVELVGIYIMGIVGQKTKSEK